MLQSNSKDLFSPPLSNKNVSSVSLNELQNKSGYEFSESNYKNKSRLSVYGDNLITLHTPEKVEAVLMGGKSSQERSSSFTEQHEMLQNVVGILQENLTDNTEEIKQAHNYDTGVYKRFIWKKLWFQIIIRGACIISVISVCMNTPQTFNAVPSLKYLTIIMDFIAGIALSFEIVLKIIAKGIILSKSSYFRSPGRVFEFVMVVCIIISVILQFLEIKKVFPNVELDYIVISFIRAPRPFLLFRVMKSLLNISLPKSVSLRSLKQIGSVLLFTAYFMSLAAVIGVQMFGIMKYYCVKLSADPNNITNNDFLIPASRCSKNYSSSFECPEGFTCKPLQFEKFRQDRRYFEHILTGLLTVYEASSMEGWSYMMYDAINTRHFAFAVVYNVALIFFIAWLVKNVFIAIITEAFADLRIQVSRLNNSSKKKNTDQRVLQKIDSQMELIRIEQLFPKNYVSQSIHKFVNTLKFKCFIYFCIFIDAVIQAVNSKSLSVSPIVFTIIFDIELILKIIAMGLKRYYNSFTCRFEGALCIGSTVLIFPLMNGYKGCALFQVMRVFRLVLISSSLTVFLNRILGSGKKLGNLLLFTLAVLVIASGVTMQLFCGIGTSNQSNNKVFSILSPTSFGDFPNATVAMFQVFMSENWNGVMNDLLWQGQKKYSWLVFITFISFHLLAATILLSVFVALILDNLELEEGVKLLKQHRQGVEVADTQEALPARIQLFEKLKPRPKLVSLDNMNECSLPKVRQSFVNKFITSLNDIEDANNIIAHLSKKSSTTSKSCLNEFRLSFFEDKPNELHYLTQLRKQSTISEFIAEVHSKRTSYKGSEVANGKLTNLKAMRHSPRISPSTNLFSPRETSSGFRPMLGIRLSNHKISTLTQENKRIQTKTNKKKDIDVALMRQKLEEAHYKKESHIDYLRENHPTFDKSLFIFSSKHPLRMFIHKIVHARYRAFNTDDKSIQVGAFSFDRLKRYIGSQTYLDWLMLLFTQISCIAMAFETVNVRVFHNSDCKVLSIIEYIFVISTSIELTLKIVADGFLFTPNAFIQDVGGVLHVFIYIFSLIYLVWQPKIIPPFSAAQYILVLRALRPLRIITLAPPLRKVVWVLLSGYKDIFKVAILQGVLMFAFASYGVQVFAEKLMKCNDPAIQNKNECVGSFYKTVASPRNLQGLKGEKTEILVPRVWSNPRNFDFDNLGKAFLALLELLSLEGWTDVRDTIKDQTGWVGILYPHAYVVAACLLGLTLFIGVIVSNFNETKGTALLTVEQKRWKDLKKKLELAQPLHLPPRPKDSFIRGKLYDFFNCKWYNRFYAFILLVNVGTLFRGQWEPNDLDSIWNSSLISIAIICCIIFFIDLVLKVVAYSFKGYWLSWRNRFDLILTLSGIVFSVWILLSFSQRNTHDEAKQFGVVIFILRFLSFSGKSNDLRMLMLTVVMSLTKCFFTIGVMLMIMACYAFVGVILFGNIKHGLALNNQANFETSYNAMLLLFRMTTGEDWNRVMRDATLSWPYCKLNDKEDYKFSSCGNTTAAYFFFHSFYFIINYIFLNLFIAVVIENFSIFYSTDDDPIMSQQDIRNFQEAWNAEDKGNSGSISVQSARKVIESLRKTLKLEKSAHPLLFKCMSAEIEKIRNGKNVFFHDLLFVVAYKKIDITKNLQLEERLARAELDDGIKEEVAAEVIREWIVRVIQQNKTKVKSQLEKKISGGSGESELTDGSLKSDFDGASVNSFPNQTMLNQNYEVQSSFDGIRKRKQGLNDVKDELYTWWNSAIDENESLLEKKNEMK
ncbi:sodium leak channel NALCN [Hydra vulgaris]|nr:sodium leak channel NALCN [Hydra vulgaris]